MGFTPRQVDQMSAWEYAACVGGFDRDEAKRKGEFADVDDHRLREMGIEGF